MPVPVAGVSPLSLLVAVVRSLSLALHLESGMRRTDPCQLTLTHQKGEVRCSLKFALDTQENTAVGRWVCWHPFPLPKVTKKKKNPNPDLQEHVGSGVTVALATMSELVANLTNSKPGSGKRQAELVQNSETVLEAREDETKGWGWGRGFEALGRPCFRGMHGQMQTLRGTEGPKYLLFILSVDFCFDVSCI